MSDPFGIATHVGHVRLRLQESVPPDALHSWRWQAQQALAQAQITPTGMPPQAILIVREVPDPAPETLLGEDGWQALQQWSAQARSWMSDCWRRAVNPAREPVSANADAVYFADRAEWLACLSWDVVSGTARSRWWWQTWLQRGALQDVGQWLFSLWIADVRALPQTIALLHRQQGFAAQIVLHQFAAHHIAELHAALTQQYGLHLPQTPPPLRTERRVDVTASPQLSAIERALAPTARSFVGMLPENLAVLVGSALVIATQPTQLHTLQHGALADVGDSSAREPDSAHVQERRSAHTAQPLADDTPPRLDAQAENSEAVAQDAPQHTRHSPLDTASANPQDADVPPQTPAQTQHDGRSHTLTDDTTAQIESTVIPHFAEDDPQIAQDDVANGQTAHDADASAALMEAAEDGIRSRIGGLWYLVNVLRELDWLYHADFAPLNAFHKLQIIALALLPEAVPDDPVWAILEELAQDDLATDIAAQWADEALPAVLHYLEEGLDDVQIFVAALQQDAMLYVTRTHIDVVFSLEQIQLALRIAGLDRNPGWTPELARIITLHYA